MTIPTPRDSARQWAWVASLAVVPLLLALAWRIGELALPPHLEQAWRDYAQRYGNDQSAERIAERGGFCYLELTDHLGHAPTTWEPVEPSGDP